MTFSPSQRTALRRLEIVARRELAGVHFGTTASRQRGQGMDFSDLRPYEPGDDIRRLDYSASARTGIPHTRLYREERAHTLTLLADISPSCTPAKRQLLAETAALLAFAAAAAGHRIALVSFSDRIEGVVRPGRGSRQAYRIAGELLTLQPHGRGTDLQPALDAAGALNRRSGLMILLSDLHFELPSRPLRALCAQHELLALMLRNGTECQPPRSGLTLVEDCEQGGHRLLDLGSTATRDSIAQSWRRNDRQIQQELSRLAIRSAVLTSDTSPLPALQRLFQAAGK
jgi:uncharacterized protein (DUF58 family)